jgi:endoglucanase
MEALGGMHKCLRTSPSPPAQVRVDGSVENSASPLGFAAAVIPYLAVLGEKDLEREQISRVRSALDPKTGLIGSPAKYYDLNLALFATGWEQHDSSSIPKVI